MYPEANRIVTCSNCDGSGRVYWNFGHSSGTCLCCGGTGRITLYEKFYNEATALGYSGEERDAKVKEKIRRYVGR